MTFYSSLIRSTCVRKMLLHADWPLRETVATQKIIEVFFLHFFFIGTEKQKLFLKI